MHTFSALLLDASSGAVWIAAIGAIGTLATSIVNAMNSYWRHKEAMRGINEVKDNVNGRMKELIAQGDNNVKHT